MEFGNYKVYNELEFYLRKQMEMITFGSLLTTFKVVEQFLGLKPYHNTKLSLSKSFLLLLKHISVILLLPIFFFYVSATDDVKMMIDKSYLFFAILLQLSLIDCQANAKVNKGKLPYGHLQVKLALMSYINDVTHIHTVKLGYNEQHGTVIICSL